LGVREHPKVENLENFFFVWMNTSNTVEPVYYRHPCDPEKVAVWKRCLIKVRFILAVDDKNRPLLTGGRCSEVVVKAGLTVSANTVEDLWVSLDLKILLNRSSSLLIHLVKAKCKKDTFHLNYIFWKKTFYGIVKTCKCFMLTTPLVLFLTLYCPFG
jgi:hypothetical protein